MNAIHVASYTTVDKIFSCKSGIHLLRLFLHQLNICTVPQPHTYLTDRTEAMVSTIIE